MKIGIIGGMGRTATGLYRDLLDTFQVEATFAEVDTEEVIKAILATRYELLDGLIAPAAKQLRDQGCTHTALACLSCQKVGNKVIAEHGMTPLPMIFNVNLNSLHVTVPPEPLTVITHSRVVNNLIAASKSFSLIKPSAEMQRKIDDLIMGPGGVGLVDGSKHPYQRELQEFLLSTPAFLGCTDLELPLGSPEWSMDIATMHCFSIDTFFQEALKVQGS